MYKLSKDIDGTTGSYIFRKEDKAHIPCDPDNTDYQEYLKWVDEGNTAEAAD